MLKALKNDRGVALILTLLIISVIVTLTLQFNASMRSEVHAAYNLRDGISLDYVAKSGFYGSLAIIKEDDPAYDCLLDDWELFREYAPFSATLFDEETSFDVSIQDLARRIPIHKLVDDQGQVNQNQRDLLTRFLNLDEFNLESDQVDDIVDAIIDWLDPDDNTTAFGGAEESYYQSLENPYSCRNSPMESIEELLLIKGISKELYEGSGGSPGIKDHLTIYGDGNININTADRLVLKALSEDINDEVFDDLDHYRRDANNQDDLKATYWIQNVVSGISFAAGTTIKSTHFEITTVGKKDRMEKRIKSIIERDGTGNIKVVSWKKS
ncbi:MAG: type II secretion system minor pseudopilin GspK [Deltaproteobacteria bacterium]|nr:type II secretion system minor pseudopilin GspK [Deltaproteobacteria bacterium]